MLKRTAHEELWALVVKYSTPERLAEEEREEERKIENRKLDAAIGRLKSTGIDTEEKD